MTTSMQRVLATMAGQEADKVPLFLLTTMHGARELGMGIEEYFSRSENVVEGQLRLWRKYRSDCLYPFFYGAVEVEAFGGETHFVDDGPPNSGAPVIRRPADIDRLEPPRVAEVAGLTRALEAIRGLKAVVGDVVPIMGVVVAPFSLPVMQLGFDRYLELLYEDTARVDRLMAVNQAFCVEWANAQLAAGATAIGYFDPVGSTTIVPRELYLARGHSVATQTLRRINGPTTFHLGSGRGLSLVEDLVVTGAQGIWVSAMEDLAEWKAAIRGRLTLFGNLNALEMRRWSVAEAEERVKTAIAKAGRGGRFVLADNHGEIPWQVPEEILLAIRDAVDRWGRYPLDWIEATR